MTRNNFYAAMMAIAMMFATGNAFAQNRRGGHDGNMGRNNGGNREMRMHGNGNVEMRGGNNANANYNANVNVNHNENYNHNYNGNTDYRDNGGYDRRDDRNYDRRDYRGNDRRDHGGYDRHDYRGNDRRDHVDYGMHHPEGPRMDERGYVRGWEGRVRHDNGRWGYYRDSRWYWYDQYYEPDYYYAHPVGHFHHHYVPVDGRVVAGVAGAVVLGSILHAIMH